MIRKLNFNKSLYYTLTESKIDIAGINKERVKIFLRKNYMKSKNINVVLDDTGEMKYAKGELFSVQYIGNIGKVDKACNMVSLSLVNEEIIEPLDSKFYICSNKFDKGKADDKFKTKLDLSRELVSKTSSLLKSEGKEIGTILGDCYYGSSDNLKTWNDDGYKYFLGSKSNRNLKNKVNCLGRDFDKLGSLVTAMKLFQNPYFKNGFQVYSFNIELKSIEHKLKVFSVISKQRERLYVTNNIEMTKKEALSLHFQRSHIDVKEYKELKTELHLLDCRFGSKEGYIRHVKLVYLCYDILRNLSLKINNTLSFGLKSLIHKLSTA